MTIEAIFYSFLAWTVICVTVTRIAGENLLDDDFWITASVIFASPMLLFVSPFILIGEIIRRIVKVM